MRLDFQRLPIPEVLGASYSCIVFSSLGGNYAESKIYTVLSSFILLILVVWGVLRSLKNLEFPRLFTLKTVLFFISILLIQYSGIGDVGRLFLLLGTAIYAWLYYRSSKGMRKPAVSVPE